MHAAWDLEAAIAKYLEVLGLRHADALAEAASKIGARVRATGAEATPNEQMQNGIAFARAWVLAFCERHGSKGQAWLEVPSVLAKWPTTFACSELPSLAQLPVDVSLVAPARATLLVREQELDVSLASFAGAASAVFQDAAFVVLEWARLR